MVDSKDISIDSLLGKPLRSELATALQVWYQHHRRDLPWRKQKSLYRVWISEIMLQQTQVATVVNYYLRFLSAFPNVRRLAQAPEQDVLKLWEGLGYYRRAKQLHRAAKIIVEQHAGRFPQEVNAVLALPGIGRYTANAILSIAVNQRLPILEGNTIRLYSRLLASKLDVTSSAGQRQLWGFAESIVPHEQPGEFNQALMELGNQICLVRNPLCAQCPLNNHCGAAQSGHPQRFPVKAQKIKYEDRHEHVLIVHTLSKSKNSKFLLRQCLPGQRWAGLWDFPRLGVTDALDSNSCESWIDRHKIRVLSRYEWPKKQRHAVTKFRITLTVTELQVRDQKTPMAGFEWVDWQRLAELPVNITARKIVNQLAMSLRDPKN